MSWRCSMRTLWIMACLCLVGCAAPRATPADVPPEVWEHLSSDYRATNTAVVVMPGLIRLWPFSEFSLIRVDAWRVIVVLPTREGDTHAPDPLDRARAEWDGAGRMRPVR